MAGDNEWGDGDPRAPWDRVNKATGEPIPTQADPWPPACPNCGQDHRDEDGEIVECRPSAPTALPSAQDAPRVTEAMRLAAREAYRTLTLPVHPIVPGNHYEALDAALEAALGTAATPGDEPVTDRDVSAVVHYAISRGTYSVEACVRIALENERARTRIASRLAQAGEATVSEAEVEAGARALLEHEYRGTHLWDRISAPMKARMLASARVVLAARARAAAQGVEADGHPLRGRIVVAITRGFVKRETSMQIAYRVLEAIGHGSALVVDPPPPPLAAQPAAGRETLAPKESGDVIHNSFDPSVHRGMASELDNSRVDQGAGAQPVAWEYRYPGGARDVRRYDLTPTLRKRGVTSRPLYAAPSPDASRAEVEAARRERDEARSALQPFAAFGDLSAVRRLPPDTPITAGSRMAARQLTAGDVQRAARALGDRP